MERIVDTTHGKLQGTEQDGYVVFKGVPYGAPPTGPRRFRPPQPADRWDGTRPAAEYGPICPQNPSPLDAMFGAREIAQDEDCLTLNVWTPDTDDVSRPVMVWIHGGGFSQGSGRTPWYDGRHFARSDVVCVTINYRLGPLGFLHTEDHFGEAFAGSGTAGLLDQVLALRWIRDNARAFGGDPENITIFGESAGGMSVAALLSMPAARGLFTKAIPQSGAAHTVHVREDAAAVTVRLCAEAGIDLGDAEALRDLPVDRLLQATLAVTTLAATNPQELFGADLPGIALAFQPVIDGRDLERRPIDALRDGAGAEVAVLVGTTRDEWGLFTALAPPEAVAQRVPRALGHLFRATGRDPEAVADVYEATLPEPAPLRLRNALETDRVFRIPAIRLAEAQAAAGAPVWMYLFAWPTPAFEGRMGSCHALEIPFVFGNLDAPGVDFFAGPDAPRDLSARMHDAWVAFAKHGDPGHAGLPGWPAYDTARRATMVLDTPCALVDDPEAERRALWEGVL